MCRSIQHTREDSNRESLKQGFNHGLLGKATKQLVAAPAQDADPQPERTRGLCREWAKSGKCSYGKRCRFSHEDEGSLAKAGEAAEPEQQRACECGGENPPNVQFCNGCGGEVAAKAANICSLFLSGKCKLGNACKNRHDVAAKAAAEDERKVKPPAAVARRIAAMAALAKYNRVGSYGVRGESPGTAITGGGGQTTPKAAAESSGTDSSGASGSEETSDSD
jgi:hypothetical protein